MGWVGDDGLHGEFQKTMGDLQNVYSIITDPPIGKREYSTLLGNYFMWDMLKPFRELQSELHGIGWGASITYSRYGKICTRKDNCWW